LLVGLAHTSNENNCISPMLFSYINNCICSTVLFCGVFQGSLYIPAIVTPGADKA